MSIPTVSERVERAGEARHVAIIGGGITGLSAAWYLQQRAAEAGSGVGYTLLEQSDRWGGKIRTERVDGSGDDPFIIEAGPDSFLTQKPWALQLAKELGLSERLLDTNDAQRKVFVLKRGRLLPLPDGVLLIIPTEFWSFVTSPLISWPGKLRMGLDFLIPPRTDGQDETIAEFVSRRLGAEAVDQLAEPLMSGIYNAEADRQSVLATFPRFREVEEKYGSLIRGMAATRKARKGAPKPEHAMFVSLRGGTQELVETLVGRLDGDLRLQTGVERVTRQNGGYELHLTNGKPVRADSVIFTTPAYVTADLLSDLAPGAAARLRAIRYVSTGTLSLGFRRSEVRHPLNGFGLVIPRSEERPINAITWTSTKFNYRAPADHVLLRVFFGGSRHPEMMHKTDAELLAIARSELKALMDIEAEPVLSRIYRWHESNPQYDAGHLDHVSAIEAELPPGLYVTGSAYRGIGIPDCVYQAQQTTSRVSDTAYATLPSSS
jgi:oxygen-dependent protoporphyrinogen oxidase